MPWGHYSILKAIARLQQPTEVLTLLEELYFEKKLPGIS